VLSMVSVISAIYSLSGVTLPGTGLQQRPFDNTDGRITCIFGRTLETACNPHQPSMKEKNHDQKPSVAGSHPSSPRVGSLAAFTLGVVTGVVLAASLLAAFVTWTEPTAHSDIGVGQITTGGEQIDTMVITDHLYLHGSGGRCSTSVSARTPAVRTS
jgi:hypothetical protein